MPSDTPPRIDIGFVDLILKLHQRKSHEPRIIAASMTPPAAEYLLAKQIDETGGLLIIVGQLGKFVRSILKK